MRPTSLSARQTGGPSAAYWCGAFLAGLLFVLNPLSLFAQTADPETPAVAQPAPTTSDPASLAPPSATTVGTTPTSVAEVNASATPEVVRSFFLLDEDTGDAGIDKLKRAVERFNNNDADGCLEALEDAVKMNENLPPARVLFAAMFLRANNLPRWRQQLELAVKESPSTPEVYLQFGDLAAREGRITDAQLNYEKAVQEATRANWAEKRRQRFLRTCYAGLTQVEAARQDWKRAQNVVNLWLRIDAEDPAAHVQLARVLFFLGKPDEAVKELEAAVELVKKNKLDMKIEKPEVQMAYLYSQDGKIDQAEKAMRSAADKYPEDGDVHAAVTNWMLLFGRIEDAQRHAALAVKLSTDKDGLDALKRLEGLAAMAAGDYSKAEEIFREQYQKAPGDLFASNYLALALIESEDSVKQQQAAQLAEVNYRVNQQSPITQATLGWIAVRLNQLPQAEQLLGAAVQNGQVTPDTAFYLAKFWHARGQLTEVVNALQASLSVPGVLFLNRREAESWYTRLTNKPAPTINPGAAAGS